MKRFVESDDRRQGVLLPEYLDDYVSENNPVRVIDVFVDELDLLSLGFDGVVPEATGRPSYHPGTLLKLYIYGYLNQVSSSRCLEREAQRNVEVMWLTGRLRHDKGLDGRHPLQDEDPRKGQNGDEPPRSGLQHQKSDPDPRRWSPHASDAGLIGPHAFSPASAATSVVSQDLSRQPVSQSRLHTASVVSGRCGAVAWRYRRAGRCPRARARQALTAQEVA